MQAIRSDITHLIRPSWLRSVPRELGSASHGKLKADQWRALGTTFLPASLIQLWSREDLKDPRSVRCRKICDVTLSLLSAVSIACSRVTFTKHADAYLQHMQSYLEGLKELFPDYKFRPNHHMALHLHEYIRFYGPVHAWWTFPFERVIGMLQRISTNYQPGKYTDFFFATRKFNHLFLQVNMKQLFPVPSSVVAISAAFSVGVEHLKSFSTAS